MTREAETSTLALTVVVATAGPDASLERVIGTLEQQSLREGVEVVLVVPLGHEVETGMPHGFANSRIVTVDPRETVDRSRAAGIRTACGDAVALLEDHAYPEADWVAALVAAHRTADVVAARIVPANHADSGLAWANFQLAYGSLAWAAPGQVDNLPAHNSSYRRATLLSFDDELEGLLERDSELHARLRASGAVFELLPVRLEHLFPSTISSSWSLRRDAGRLYAARRARTWTRARRAIFVIASPAIPALRGLRMLRSESAPGKPSGGRAVAALGLLLVADAVGQALGYARGDGGAKERLARFEEGRLRHVTRRDLGMVTSAVVPDASARSRRRAAASPLAEARPPLRVVQLGLGPAGRHLHLTALRRVPNVEVVAACDPDPASHVHAPPGARVFDDAHEALALPCDVVLVATPPETHAELACVAIEAGRHVYLEKPMATSVVDAQDVAELASRRDVALQMGFAYRYHPLWRRVRHARVSGVLRGPIRADAHFTTMRGGDGWRNPVVDLASHHVDLLSWVLAAEPVELEATQRRLRVAWADGSELSGLYEVAEPVDRVSLVSATGSIALDRLRGTRLTGSALRPSSMLPSPGLLRARLGGLGWERSFEYALRAFTSAVRDGRPVTPDATAGVRAVAVGEATLRSLERGGTVRL